MLRQFGRPAARPAEPAYDDFAERRSVTYTIGSAAAPDLRRRRQAEAIHRRGARLLFELLEELRRYHPTIAGDIDRRIAAYAAADPATLATAGADRFPPLPPPRLVATRGGRLG